MFQINEDSEGVIFKIKVQPRSSKNEICGEIQDCLKIKITAPANDNKANIECISFLSKVFKVSKSSINILQGDKSREKLIKIHNISKEDILNKI